MGHPSARSLPRTYVPSASLGRLWAIVCRPSGAGPIFIGYTHGLRRGLHSFAASRLRARPIGGKSKSPPHASVPLVGMLRLRSRFVTRAGKPGSGEGQNTNGLRVVESHFSQRTREMGQPAAVVVRAEKQVPRLRVSVLRTITLRSG